MSKQALELVRKLFVAVADREEITEQQRQILAAMDNFEAGVCFSKLDQDQKGYVSKEDILSLLTSNGITDVSEQSISYMIKYFDSMENDKLNMNDFTQILLPCANDYLRSRASNRRLHHEVDAFSKEVQGQLSTLIQKECEYHTEIESIKKEIASSENYDPKEIFRAIDTNMHDFLDSNTIEEFLKSQGFKASKTDLNSIIRRFDVTADARISYTEFAEGITQANIPLSLPQEFSKPGYPYNNLRNTPQPNLNSMEPQKMPNFEKRDYGMEYQQPSPYRAEKYPPPQREEYDPKMPRMKYQEFVQPRQSYPNSIIED